MHFNHGWERGLGRRSGRGDRAANGRSFSVGGSIAPPGPNRPTDRPAGILGIHGGLSTSRPLPRSRPRSPHRDSENHPPHHSRRDSYGRAVRRSAVPCPNPRLPRSADCSQIPWGFAFGTTVAGSTRGLLVGIFLNHRGGRQPWTGELRGGESTAGSLLCLPQSPLARTRWGDSVGSVAIARHGSHRHAGRAVPAIGHGTLQRGGRSVCLP